MTPEELVGRRVEAINTGNFEALGDVFTPDVITHYGSGEAVRGVEALGGLMSGLASFSDLAATIEDLVVDGDRVGARYTTRGRQRGEFLGIPNSGVTVEFGGAGIHRIEGGKIAEVWTVDDWADLTRQVRAGHAVASVSAASHTMRETEPVTVDANKRTASHWVELVNARAFDRLSEDWAQDVTVNQGRDREETVGLDALVALLKTFYAGMSDLVIDVEDVVGAGDIVFLRTRSHGTHSGDLFGIPATGRAVSYKGIATYYLADGKIIREWFNDDMFALMNIIAPAADSATSRMAS
jgi:steroid delta-isomerase-like uncharacterized protein